MHRDRAGSQPESSLYSAIYSAIDSGIFVTCCHIGRKQLLPLGADRGPGIAKAVARYNPRLLLQGELVHSGTISEVGAGEGITLLLLE
jgi:hypothetical protein